MSLNRGLPKLTGGIRKRERDAWERLPHATCGLSRCDLPAVALVQRWDGSFGYICEAHAPQIAEIRPFWEAVPDG